MGLRWEAYSNFGPGFRGWNNWYSFMEVDFYHENSNATNFYHDNTVERIGEGGVCVPGHLA